MFPEEQGAAPHLKLLEAAYRWKRQKLMAGGAAGEAAAVEAPVEAAPSLAVDETMEEKEAVAAVAAPGAADREPVPPTREGSGDGADAVEGQEDGPQGSA